MQNKVHESVQKAGEFVQNALKEGVNTSSQLLSIEFKAMEKLKDIKTPQDWLAWHQARFEDHKKALENVSTVFSKTSVAGLDEKQVKAFKDQARTHIDTSFNVVKHQLDIVHGMMKKLTD